MEPRSILVVILVVLLIYVLFKENENFKGNSGDCYPRVIYLCDDQISTEKSEKPKKPKLMCKTVKNTDYFGNTYSSSRVNNSKACCELCLGEHPKCKSWTYDRNEQICRLKNTEKRNVSKCPYRTSGYIYDPNKPKPKPSPKPKPKPSPKPSPKPKLEPVTIYQHNDFKGKNKSFGLGRHDMGQLGIGNDQLSSIRVSNGYRAVLYQHAKFGGKQLTLTGDTRAMPKGWNDQTSSLVVEQVNTTRQSKPSPKPASTVSDAVTIYRDSKYRGANKKFGVGRFNMRQLGIGNDQLSSVRVKPGYRVKLYQHANFGGNHLTLTNDMPNMPMFWNDQTSSLVVEKI